MVFPEFFYRMTPPPESSCPQQYRAHLFLQQTTFQGQSACAQTADRRAGLHPARPWRFGSSVQILRSSEVVYIAGALAEEHKTCLAGGAMGPQNPAPLPATFLLKAGFQSQRILFR